MQAIHIILAVPLIGCLLVLALYGIKLVGTSRPSKAWRTVGTFTLYFACVYAVLAAFMLYHINEYIPRTG